MKKLWLFAGLLGLCVFLVWIILVKENHPDTSSVASYAPYLAFRGDIAPSWSPDDKQIIFSRGDPERQDLYLIPADGGTSRPFLNGDGGLPVWSPDGTRVASGSADHTVRVWDMLSGSTLLTYTGNTSSVLTVAWSPDGTRIASGGYDRTIQVWDSLTGRTLLVYHGHSRHIASLSWSPDSTRIASGSYDGTVRVWNANSGSILLIYHSNTSAVSAVAWSPDGKHIASGSEGAGAAVDVWDAATGTASFHYLRHTNGVLAVSWSPLGSLVASGGEDATVQVWQAAS